MQINVDELPNLDDLVRLIQTTENVNQQLLFENKYLKEETTRAKSNILKLIEENTLLHKELKNTTVLEILNEIENSMGNLLYENENIQTNFNTQVNVKNKK